MRTLCLLLAIAANGFYLDDHDDYSTRIKGENPQEQFDELVQREVDAGKTLVVRWVAGVRCRSCQTQALTWNRAIKKYASTTAVSFADVLLSESLVIKAGGDGIGAGQGGWPTIRYFNQNTGYNGEAYIPKTDEKLHDELSQDTYMNLLIEEAIASLQTIDPADEIDPAGDEL
jgi:hypothetical protein